jgi:hypothetical protein
MAAGVGGLARAAGRRRILRGHAIRRRELFELPSRRHRRRLDLDGRDRALLQSLAAAQHSAGFPARRSPR